MIKITKFGGAFAFAITMLVGTTAHAQLFNFPPNAVKDEATTLEDTPVKLNVVANDSDINGNLDPSTVDLNIQLVGIQKTATITAGTFDVDDVGEVTFTPTIGFNGNAVVKYNVSDSQGLASNDVNITIKVEAVNAAPVAVADEGTTTEETDVMVNVVANDTDADGTIDTSKVDLDVVKAGVQKSFKATEGDWSADKGNVTFKPKKEFSGVAKIDYRVSDNEGALSNIVSITITVTPKNQAPVAKDDTGGTTVNQPVTVNVVTNDTDVDGTIDPTKVDLNTTTAGIQSTASTPQGSYAASATGDVTYTPLAGFAGTAELSYAVSDNQGGVSNIAKLTITVQAENVAPTAANDNATTTKNKAVDVNVVANDTDPDGGVDVSKVDLNPTVTGIQNTADTPQGSYIASALGVVKFTPTLNFTGIAAINYTVLDKAGAASNEATINITVQDVNSLPVAVNDNAATSQNMPVSFNVAINDTDADGVVDPSKIDLNTTTAGIQNTATTAQGGFAVNSLGLVTFTPIRTFTGSATLKYTIRDNVGGVSNEATITVAVQPTNAPIANDDQAITSVNKAVDLNLLANDKDPDGSLDAASVDLNPTTAGIQKTFSNAQGSFTVNNTGIVTYTPKKDFFGPASAKYTVADDNGVSSNAANVIVTVNAIPAEAPVIIAFEDNIDTLRYAPGISMSFTDKFEVRDTDSDTLALAEIGIVAESYQMGTDLLTFTNTSKINGTFNAQTGVLRLQGWATAAEYTQAVKTVKYNNSAADELKVSLREIYVRVSDGAKFSQVAMRNVKVSSSVSDLDIPTAFTPNSDGANDTWRILVPSSISGPDFADAEIKVYDKRGTMVFGVNGFDRQWDGTYEGRLLPVDTYYYTIDLKQQQKRYKGMVVILR